MPTNETSNYHLNQWVRSDRILMEDFNADNAKIDAALADQAGTLTAHTAALARKGNCSIGFLTYTGDGTFGSGSPTVIRFPRKPAAFFVMAGGTIAVVRENTGAVNYNGGTSSVSVTWSGYAASITTGNGLAAWQLNAKNATYTVLALYDMS